MYWNSKSSSRETRSKCSISSLLYVLKSRTEYNKHSFRLSTAFLWNQRASFKIQYVQQIWKIFKSLYIYLLMCVYILFMLFICVFCTSLCTFFFYKGPQCKLVYCYLLRWTLLLLLLLETLMQNDKEQQQVFWATWGSPIQ